MIVYFILVIAAVDIIIVLSYTRLIRTTLVLRVLVIVISFGSYVFSWSFWS
jgi:hypothetical protein